MAHLEPLSAPSAACRSPRGLLVTPPQSPPVVPVVAPMPPVPAMAISGRPEDAFRVNTPEDERGRMIKQIKGCLNKITPEKYDALASQIVAFFEPSTSDAIVPLIFEKALNELNFAEMYADLFCDLLHKISTCVQSHTTFLMALMLRCNLELTKALHADEAEGQNSEGQEGEHKNLKRSVGISHFIGELFVRDLLKEDFLFKVSSKLLHLTEPACDAVKETEAEVACKLIETAGAHWEASTLRFKVDVLPRIEDIRDRHPKARVRFLFLDLSDLRARGWKHRFEKRRPHRLTKDSSRRPGSPLHLPEPYTGIQLPDGRTMNDPYGQTRPFAAVSAGDRASTPQPTRAMPISSDPYDAQKRGMTPPPRRMPPFMPHPPTPPSLPLPSPQPLSPALPYHHEPYATGATRSSSSVSSPQLQWADVAQTNWQSIATEEVPTWQQHPQQRHPQRQGAAMPWQQEPTNQGWQSPQSGTQWAGGMVWDQPNSAGSSGASTGSIFGGDMQAERFFPVQLPAAVLRQPSPGGDPRRGHGGGPSLDVGAASKGKTRRGPLSPHGKSRHTRESPTRLQLPVDPSLMDVRVQPPGPMTHTP